MLYTILPLKSTVINPSRKLKRNAQEPSVSFMYKARNDTVVFSKVIYGYSYWFSSSSKGLSGARLLAPL